MQATAPNRPPGRSGSMLVIRVTVSTRWSSSGERAMMGFQDTGPEEESMSDGPVVEESFDDISAVIEPPEAGILSRTVVRNDRLRTVLFGFAAGEELSEHTAAVPAIMHILKGRARLTVGERSMDGNPGTWVLMPAHQPHSVTAVEPTVMLLLMLR